MSGVLSEQEVAKIESEWDPEVMGAWHVRDAVGCKLADHWTAEQTKNVLALARSHEALRAERDELRKLLARVVRENCEFSDDPPRVRGFDPHRDTDLSDEETNLLRRALAEGES